MFSELRNKEFGLIDFLLTGLSIFKLNFSTILIITLLVDLPFSLFRILGLMAGVSSSLFKLGGLLSIWTSMAVMFIVERHVFGEKVVFGAALKKAGSRYGIALKSSILYSFAVVLRLLLLIIPGIIYAVNITFLLQAVILREQGWKSAFTYSRNLVKGSWWKVFLTFLTLFFVLYYFPSIIVSYIAERLIEVSGKETSLRITIAVASNLISSLLYYLFTVSETVYFLNLDYRKSLSS